MAVDRRSSHLGMLAVVGDPARRAGHTPLVPAKSSRSRTYQEQVDLAKQRTVLIPPERGRIFDAEGRILADNQRILTVTIDWKVIRKKTQRAKLFARLSGVLKIPIEEMENRYAGPVGDDGERTGTIYDPLLPLPLKEGVDEATVQYLLERKEDFPGVDARAADGGGCTPTRRSPATSSATSARSPRPTSTTTAPSATSSTSVWVPSASSSRWSRTSMGPGASRCGRSTRRATRFASSARRHRSPERTSS